MMWVKSNLLDQLTKLKKKRKEKKKKKIKKRQHYLQAINM